MQKLDRKIDCVFDSFKGKRRNKNKDGILVAHADQYSLFGVFDGVSSAKEAKRGVSFAISFIKKKHSQYFQDGHLALARLMIDLNRSLVEAQMLDPYTTYSIACVPRLVEGDILISSLGDSRIYSVANQYVSQVSFLRNDHVHSNFISCYLGNENLVESDFVERTYSCSGGDLLICSDGFYLRMESSPRNLSEAHRVLNLKSLKWIKKGLAKLISGANDDDASYVLVRLNDVCQ